MRASASAWLSGESLGVSAGCCSCARVLLDGSKKRPPRSAAATGACSFGCGAGVVSAVAGAREATAEAIAARRANSRREIATALSGPGLDVWSIKSPAAPSARFGTCARQVEGRLLKGALSVNSAEGWVQAKKQGRLN